MASSKATPIGGRSVEDDPYRYLIAAAIRQACLDVASDRPAIRADAATFLEDWQIPAEQWQRITKINLTRK